MTKDEIKFLINSGFSISEITEMINNSDNKANSENTIKQNSNAEENANSANNTEENANSANNTGTENTNTNTENENAANNDNAELFKSLKESMDSLRKAIQSSNMKNTIIENGNKEVENITDILNQIAEEYK